MTNKQLVQEINSGSDNCRKLIANAFGIGSEDAQTVMDICREKNVRKIRKTKNMVGGFDIFGTYNGNGYLGKFTASVRFMFNSENELCSVTC